jgi:hypothetical protein
MSKKGKMMLGAAIIVIGILVATTLITTLNPSGPSAGLPYMCIAGSTDGAGIYIVRTDVHGSSYYTTIDNQGNILVNKKILVNETFPNATSDARDYAIAVDSNKDIHILYVQNLQPAIFYTKITNDGNVLIPKIPVGRGTRPKLVIDSNNYLHMVWYDGTTAYTGRYKRLDGDGNTLVEHNITNVYPSLHIGIDSNNYIHITGFKYDTGATYEGKAYYIYHGILDSNGTILDTKIFISNASAIDEYHMIEDDNGRLIYLEDKGTVDIDSNIHLIWLNNGIWYKKLNRNGTILINNKKVASGFCNAGPIMVSDTSDNMYILGLYAGKGLGFIKIDKNGNILLDKMIEVQGG